MKYHKHSQIKQSILTIINKNKSTGKIFSCDKKLSPFFYDQKLFFFLDLYHHSIGKYHLQKQLFQVYYHLIQINNSINTINTHLKRKKQQLVILNVPFIQSEQASIRVKQSQVQQVIKSKQYKKQSKQNAYGGQSGNTKGIMKTKSSVKMSKVDHLSSVNTECQKKMIISIQLGQYAENAHYQFNQKENDSLSENFTDQEQTDKNSRKSSNDCNSRSSFGKRLDCSKLQLKEVPFQNKVNEVSQSLLKTAHFSIGGTHSKAKSMLTENQDHSNKQNKNRSSCQLKSKKIQMLLRLQIQKQLYREKTKKIIKQDQQYLNKLLKKNQN